MFAELISDLTKLNIPIQRNARLSEWTTIEIGGPALLLLVVKNWKELFLCHKILNNYGVSFKFIGNGSNLIVSDRGFKGVIIINRADNWRILEMVSSESATGKGKNRRIPVNSTEDADNLPVYSDENAADVIVRVESGAPIIRLMKELFIKGITGLQWFSGIPATVGGAIYMNMHGGSLYFGHLVQQALISDGENCRRVDQSYFRFDYDWSILHETKELVLWNDLKLKYGNVAAARKLALDRARQKRIQPQKSAGCIFKNLTPEQQKRLNLNTPSTGYIIDKILDLKGRRCGDAVISTRHAAFIENLGQAKAAEVMELIQIIKDRAKEKLGISLQPEVEFIGFNDKD